MAAAGTAAAVAIAAAISAATDLTAWLSTTGLFAAAIRPAARIPVAALRPAGLSRTALPAAVLAAGTGSLFNLGARGDGRPHPGDSRLYRRRCRCVAIRPGPRAGVVHPANYRQHLRGDPRASGYAFHPQRDAAGLD